ncbi:hypothetical protein J3R30DRAFT_3441121 [Lentinula aciculospora]|uniref:Uncharacterized protein n=1 Tax=Lentinula aciculospora TaxID=153920 RepID=A0A9W9DTU1_9AGAR|nr:hypothetical protein J3R30DRAFT_3441121 [Lentinula aciculospora]
MSNVGNKVKGAFNTVHGIGENVRATALGAVDTIAHDKEGEVKNDQIAQQGRFETERGMEQMSGRSRNMNAMANYDTTTADPTLSANSTANTTTDTTTNPATNSEYPQHHRDNEVYNDSQAQAVYNQENNAPSQPGYNAAGGAQPSRDTGYGAGQGGGSYGSSNNTVNSQNDAGNSQYDSGNPRY